MGMTFQISISDSLVEWLTREAANRGLSTPAQFVEQMLQNAQEKAAIAEIDRQLLESIASGDSVPHVPGDWDRLRERARAMAMQRASK